MKKILCLFLVIGLFGVLVHDVANAEKDAGLSMPVDHLKGPNTPQSASIHKPILLFVENYGIAIVFLLGLGTGYVIKKKK